MREDYAPLFPLIKIRIENIFWCSGTRNSFRPNGMALPQLEIASRVRYEN